MTPRPSVREVPNSDRYWSVCPSGEDFHFRFPSYGRAAKMVGLLQDLQVGDGLEKLIQLLDVAGYCIGSCWFHRAYDLEAGKPPRSLEGDAWREYGDEVIDELQEHGVKLAGIMALTNSLMEQLAARMSEVEAAKETAGN